MSPSRLATPVDQTLLKPYDEPKVQKILRLSVSLSFATSCLWLSTCDAGRLNSAQNAAKGKPILSAEPNPIPAGNPDQALATTVITWNTGSKADGDLYVKVNRSPDLFLARSPSGQLKIDWIQFDSTYEFRLYVAKKHSKLLAKLDVTRDN
jgi:hypothetical protein